MTAISVTNLRLVLLTWILLSLSGLQVLSNKATEKPIHKKHSNIQFTKEDNNDGIAKTGSHGDRKVLFKNGTKITGVGQPPKVWQVWVTTLVGTEGKNVSTKCKDKKDYTVVETRGIRANLRAQRSLGTAQNMSVTFILLG